MFTRFESSQKHLASMLPSAICMSFNLELSKTHCLIYFDPLHSHTRLSDGGQKKSDKKPTVVQIPVEPRV